MLINKNILFIATLLVILSCTPEETPLTINPTNEIEDTNQPNQNIPSNLQFDIVNTFQPNLLEGISMGMTHSESENSLYISSRDEFPLELGQNREQILKLDLSNGSITERTFNQSDLITKRLFISDDKLISFGAQFVNTYDLNIVGNPVTQSHQKFLSRFKIAQGNNNIIYVVGGDLLGNDSNKVFEWNADNPQDFVELTTLPQAKNGGGSAIINDHLYIFGGSTDNSLNNPTDKIYTIPLAAPDMIQEQSMGIALPETYVQAFNEYIIVCGESVDGNSIIGAFNTLTKEFELIDHNLTDINQDYEIGQMTIVDNTLYLVYGFVEALSTPGTGLSSEWSVISAELE